MLKRYIVPNIKLLELDQEFMRAKQDSTGEQDGRTILSNEGMFDEEENEDLLPKVGSIWE